MRSRVKLYFDGGCRPAGMETAVVAQGRTWLRADLGPGTAMDAEWLALLHAVEIARDLALGDPVFLGDSLAVVGQATGIVKCRPAFVRHLSALAAMSATPPHIRHIRRTQNLAGIALSARYDR